MDSWVETASKSEIARLGPMNAPGIRPRACGTGKPGESSYGVALSCWPPFPGGGDAVGSHARARKPLFEAAECSITTTASSRTAYNRV